MPEQQPTATEGEPSGGAGATVPVERSQRRPVREWFFNKEVHDHAVHNGWRPFHVEGFRVARGKGFPDLAMFRQDPETGLFDMLVAELKRDAGSKFGEGQKDWLEAFKQMGITTKVWRGDNPKHLRELYDIIESGTAGHDSVTKPLPVRSSSPLPANFRVVIDNTIESIEGGEMTTGENASLRRMDIDNPGGAIFWKLISQRGIPQTADFKKWGLIMHGIALMAHGAGRAHNPTMPVGSALYLGGEQQPGERGFYSEDRLATLLAAKGPTLHRLLARLFRILGNKERAFDWREMAWFILNEGYSEEQAEQSRIKIARAYYQIERHRPRQSERQGDC